MNEYEFKEMVDLSYRIRGLIIQSSSYLEKAIEYYIATYFCGETSKCDFFIETLLTNDVRFKAKVNSFFRILNLEQSLIAKYPNLKTDLNKILAIRNSAAHELLDTSKEGREYYNATKRICFTKLYSKNRTDYHYDDIEELNSFFHRTTSIITSELNGFEERQYSAL
jgi:hypothetical protein